MIDDTPSPTGSPLRSGTQPCASWLKLSQIQRSLNTINKPPQSEMIESAGPMSENIVGIALSHWDLQEAVSHMLAQMVLTV